MVYGARLLSGFGTQIPSGSNPATSASFLRSVILGGGPLFVAHDDACRGPRLPGRWATRTAAQPVVADNSAWIRWHPCTSMVKRRKAMRPWLNG